MQIVNPTAGLFAGDELTFDIEIGAGARVALTSPSAARFHTMPGGKAELRQDFRLGEGAWLDFWPEMMIPQRDSETSQRTRLFLEKGASAVFLDSLAPGRVAHGENCEFRRLETRFELWQEGNLLVKERAVMTPGNGHWPLVVPGWERCYYAAIWIVDGKAEEAAGLEKILSEAAGDARCGFSLLEDGLGVLRILAPSSLVLRKILAEARRGLQESVPLLATDFRKI